MRLNDENRGSVKVGDRIVSTKTESEETLTARVVSVERGPSFEDLYANYPPVVLGYRDGEKGDPSDMGRYYPKHDVEKYAVLAIGVEPTG